MSDASCLVYITFIETEGAFLKVWGQTDRNLPIAIEKSLAQASPQFEIGQFVPPIDSLYIGQLLCAKYKDGMYYRARITNTSLLHQGILEVHFVDYGNKDYLPYLNTRIMSNVLSNLVSIPPQAKEFILAHVTHPDLTWSEGTITQISNEIRYIEMQCSQLIQVGPYVLIRLINANGDLALNLVARRILLSISLQSQQMILQSYIGRPQVPAVLAKTTANPNMASSIPTSPVATNAQVVSPSPAVTQPSPALLTYKALTLEPDSEHAIYVSYVSDGPLQFSVQLKKMESALAKLMCELNHMTLQPLEDNPMPGTVCVARCIEDSYICRAVVTSMVDSQFKVCNPCNNVF